MTDTSSTSGSPNAAPPPGGLAPQGGGGGGSQQTMMVAAAVVVALIGVIMAVALVAYRASPNAGTQVAEPSAAQGREPAGGAAAGGAASEGGAEPDDAPGADEVVTPDPAQVVEPRNLSNTGGIIAGDPNAPVTADVFFDFLCPACLMFEQYFAPVFAPFVEDGTLKVQYHPVSILDRKTGESRYSSRSANAAYCLADAQPEVAEPFIQALLNEQPELPQAGLTNEELAQVAAEVGATEEMSTCLESEGFVPFAELQLRESGIRGTPTLFLNGVQAGDDTNPDSPQVAPDAVKAYIEKLAGE